MNAVPYMNPPVPANERSRIIELAELDIDYSASQRPLEGLAKLAARIAGTSVSLVNLIDSYTQWTVASFGLSIEQMSREDSVCQYTIAQDGVFEVKDLSQDERFHEKFYVAGDAGLRYYYGIPLQTPRGGNLGALCFLDKETQTISQEKSDLLKMIADEIVARLLLQREINGIKEKIAFFDQTHKRVAHDIRGPLGGILGLTELMLESGTEGNIQEILEFVQMIQKSSRGLLDLADEILCNTEELSLPESDITLGDLKGKLEKLFTPQGVAKQIDFQVNVEQGKQDLSISKSGMLQIVGNLISNAIKFTPIHGSVEVDLKQILNGRQSSFEISVRDSGMGMDQAEIEEILTGESTPHEGTVGEKGYGFGLQLVQRLVTGLGGTLQIHSRPSHGTCFTVSLPHEK